MGNDFLPNSYSTPNAYCDRFMHLLTPVEWKVLSYAVRRIFGFQKRQDNISLSQFCEGQLGKDGRPRDHGTGLSAPAVSAALADLAKYGLMTKVKDNDPATNKGALWALQLDSDQVDVAGLENRQTDRQSSNQGRTTKARNEAEALRRSVPLTGFESAEPVSPTDRGGSVPLTGGDQSDCTGGISPTDTQKPVENQSKNQLNTLRDQIDAHLHTLYNGQYARLNPVIRVDDVFGIITIGVETDAPQLAAQVRTYLKGLKARHKVKVVQTPAVTSGDSQTPADQLKAALKDEYYQCRGGAVFVDDNVERAALDHLAAQQWTRAMLRAAYEQLNTKWRQDHKVPVTLAAIARFIPGGSHASHQPNHSTVVDQSVIDAINAANRARLQPGV